MKVPLKMNTGVSLYNVGTSLDLEALTRAGSQNNSHEDEESDDNDEEENRNAEVLYMLNDLLKLIVIT